jgi:peptide subunit release factor 1 (eRF1)
MIKMLVSGELEHKEVAAKCPHCGNEISFEFGQARRGETIVCPECNTEVKLKLESPDELDRAQASMDEAVKTARRTIQNVSGRASIAPAKCKPPQGET